LNDSALKFYVIGDPIDHSLSPLLQNFLLEKFRINGKYAAQRVRAESLAEAMKFFLIDNAKGFNVTTPHKRAVLKYINHLTPEAEAIGGVNTIKIEHGKFAGHNTDAIGFQNSLRLQNYSFKDQSAIIFGAGGAARAVTMALIREQCSRITIINRNVEKAEKMVTDFLRRFAKIEFAALPLNSDKINEIIKSAQLLVNATTVGMGDLINDSILPGTDGLHHDLLVYDLIYRPYKTRLIQQAERYGVPGMNGLDMLILQGIESLKFWTERDLVLDSSSYAEVKNLLRREICQE